MYIKKMKNAYGIRELSVDENLKISNSVVYASNGVFKSSFASTLDKLSQGEGDEVLDRFRTGNKLECEINLNGKDYSERDIIKNVLVYSHDLYQDKQLNNYDFISQIMILESERNKLDDVLNGLEKDKKLIKDILSKTSERFNLHNILKYNSVDIDNKNDFELIDAFIKLLCNCEKKDFTHLDKIKWGNFFNSMDSGATSNSVYKYIETENFKESVNSYIKLIEREIEDTVFDADFNDLNYNDFIKSVNDTSFLSDTRTIKFYVKDGEVLEFNDVNDLKSFLTEKIKDIREDESILKEYNEITTGLEKNKDGRELLELIQNDLSILDELKEGIDTMMLNKIAEDLGTNLEMLENNFNEYGSKIDEIKASIVDSRTTYDEAIEIYTKRFQYSPIQPCIEGSEKNIALGLTVPMIKFKHTDDPKDILRNEDEIYSYLSSGEKTALKILHFIVQYLSMSKEDGKLLLVFDDIVETFDYYNRNAMLEYINDITIDGNKVIVLTHNYDFYQYVASRIPNMQKLRAYTKTENNYTKVLLRKYETDDLGIRALKNINNFRDLVAAIPFFRQIIEFTEGTSSKNYLFFTNLLHIKKENKDITVQKIVETMKEIFPDVDIKYVFDPETKYYDQIINKDITISDELNLKDKIFLSIQSRLISEHIILKDDYSRADNITTNQTRTLLEQNRENLTDDEVASIEKTLRITSEFIHLNSFMYEPLVDVNSDYLARHIKNLKDLVSVK